MPENKTTFPWKYWVCLSCHEYVGADKEDELWAPDGTSHFRKHHFHTKAVTDDVAEYKALGYKESV